MNRTVLKKSLGCGNHLEIGRKLMVWVELDAKGALIHTKNRLENIKTIQTETIYEAIEQAIDMIIKQANEDLSEVLLHAHALGYEQEDLIHLVKSIDVEEIMES